MTNAISKETGDFGEQTAKKYLIEKGYRFVSSNFCYAKLEIDLIFEDEESHIVIFVEVKTRSSLRFGSPEEAISHNKQKNIRTASDYFLRFNKEFRNHKRRYDSVSVLKIEGEWKINHIQNSF
jgi:putative endonuclease